MAAGQSIAPFPADVDRDAFGHWLSGFTDGEGCFYLGRRHDRKRIARGIITDSPFAHFCIGLRLDDMAILGRIQAFFGVGWLNSGPVYRGKSKPHAEFRVIRTKELIRVVIPHFERYPLRAKKARDFAVWKQAVELLHRVGAKSRHHPGKLGAVSRWTEEDRREFEALTLSLREGRQYMGESQPVSSATSGVAKSQMTMFT